MVSVVDEFGVDLIEIENRAQCSGFAVVEGAHRVICMGCVGEPGLDCRLNFGVSGVGVSGGYDYALLFELLYEGKGVGLFRGKGDEAKPGVVEDFIPGRWLSGDWDDGLGRLGTGVFGGDEGSFEVESPDKGMIWEIIDRGLNR